MKKNTCMILVLIVALLLSACSSASAPSHDSSAPMVSGIESTDGYYPPDASGEGDWIMDETSSGESYLEISENRAKSTDSESTLTFSLKVDTAAYTNVARYIQSGNTPPKDAVRTEELLNYFTYDGDMKFDGDSPFALYTEVGPSPFDSDKYMAFIRVKTEDIAKEELPPCNLTFLIDTSGSMDSHDKLPLLKEAFTLLVETLDEDDTVSIVTYAGSSDIVLDSVHGDRKDEIISAINTLRPAGSTAGADGINTAYKLAEKNFKENGNNRVILATDGDFNVGPSSTSALEKLVEKKRDGGVYLSILGFGTGNIRDDIMETLSKHGNGNYSYINSVHTAKKVLVDELGSNLFTIANDVKAQVEFNPQNVKSYRLIGYENRQMSNKDFDDDTKDAGEIGVGTDVVVMFELELHGGEPNTKYTQAETKEPDFANELFEVRIRYKDPGESESKLITNPVFFSQITDFGSTDFNFASSVAAFGHILRGSEYTGDATIQSVIAMAKDSKGKDSEGYRSDHIALLEAYSDIA